MDMNATEKNALISAAILAQVASGRPLPEAIDAVLGAGTYQKLAGEVYDQLKARTK